MICLLAWYFLSTILITYLKKNHNEPKPLEELMDLQKKRTHTIQLLGRATRNQAHDSTTLTRVCFFTYNTKIC